MGNVKRDDFMDSLKYMTEGLRILGPSLQSAAEGFRQAASRLHRIKMAPEVTITVREVPNSEEARRQLLEAIRSQMASGGIKIDFNKRYMAIDYDVDRLPPSHCKGLDVGDFGGLNSRERGAKCNLREGPFAGKTCLIRLDPNYSTICFVQFDEMIMFDGINYGSGWHCFSVDAFDVYEQPKEDKHGYER